MLAGRDLAMSTLYEKYRPRTFQEVVGQPSLIRDLERMQAGGDFVGDAFWVSGETEPVLRVYAWLAKNYADQV